jgi:hypothetical protein
MIWIVRLKIVPTTNNKQSNAAQTDIYRSCTSLVDEDGFPIFFPVDIFGLLAI